MNKVTQADIDCVKAILKATSFSNHGANVTTKACEIAAAHRRASTQTNKLAKALDELLSWAKSVEGHSVSVNLTGMSDSVFSQARDAIKEHQETSK